MQTWRRRQAKATVRHKDLRAGRPEPPEIGSPCQRCDCMTEDIQCVYGNYWLCPACVRFHQGLARLRRNSRWDGACL